MSLIRGDRKNELLRIFISVASQTFQPPQIFFYPWRVRQYNRHGYAFTRGGYGNITATDKLFRVPFSHVFASHILKTKHTVHLFQNLVGSTTHTYIKHSYTYIITCFTDNSHIHIVHSLFSN